MKDSEQALSTINNKHVVLPKKKLSYYSSTSPLKSPLHNAHFPASVPKVAVVETFDCSWKGRTKQTTSLIYLAEILKTYLKTSQNFPHRSLATVSGYCGEIKHRGLAVLAGLIVKLSP